MYSRTRTALTMLASAVLAQNSVGQDLSGDGPLPVDPPSVTPSVGHAAQPSFGIYAPRTRPDSGAAPLSQTPGKGERGAAGPEGGPSGESFGPGPVNDACANAMPIAGEGVFLFDTTGATMDLVPPYAACFFFGSEDFQNDVWYCWTATSTGIVTIETCGLTVVDTRLAAFDQCGICPPPDATLLACTDDNCGLQSQIQFATNAGSQYRIRVGVYPGADAGPGQFQIYYGAGCDVLCNGTLENEPNCGLPDTVNGGCNSSPPVFSPIVCGQTVCGTAAFNGQIRDTDWYQVIVTSDTELTWTVDAEFDVVLGLIDNNGGPSCMGVTQFATAVSAVPCQQASIVACVPPGAWWLFVAPDFLSPVPCGREYRATLTCAPCVALDGACCIDGECQIVSRCRCEKLGGVFAGEGTVCSVGLCPTNDDCDDAHFVLVPSSTLGNTTLAAIDEPPAFFCGTSVQAPGLWYTLLGNGTTITVSTCATETNYDSKINVYCGTCDELECIGGNDDAPCGFSALDSTFSFCSEANVVYHVLVQGFGASVGNFRLNVSTDGVLCGGASPCDPCFVTCEPGAIDEIESCGQRINDGCNLGPPAYQQINCGDQICGTAFADANIRDTDWYQFTLLDTRAVKWSVRAEFPVAAFLLRVNQCPANVELMAAADGPPCEEVRAQTVLGPGTYVAFVGPGRTAAGLRFGFPCGLKNDYTAELTCEPTPTACDELPAPYFTIDIPSLVGGLAVLDASDVLTIPGPSVAIDGVNMRLNSECDALDGISFDNVGVGPLDTFLLRFSVDRESDGAVGPDLTLDGLGLPYNVQQQAENRQAAADEFVSLLEFTRSGPILPFNSLSSNNTKTRNQSDAGGVDYFLEPLISPDQFNPEGQSNVDGSAKTPGSFLGPPTYIFFSLTAMSPSLAGLPGTLSGADVYIDFNTGAPGGEQLYVSPGQLGLQVNDDIDGLTVFDDGDHLFEPGIDEIQFSLAVGSPSLAGASPADIFRSQGGGVFIGYATADDLGLLPTDNIDAIEFSRCTSVLSCVTRWGIGFVDCDTIGCYETRGDTNCDAAVDFFDIDPFLLALFNPVAYQATYCGGSICWADADCNGVVDFFDIDPFLQCLFGVCPECP